MRHNSILFAAFAELLLPAAPASAQVTVDLRALDALPVTHSAVPHHAAALPRPVAKSAAIAPPAIAAGAPVHAAPMVASARPQAPAPAAPPRVAPATAAAAPPLPTMDAGPPPTAELAQNQSPALPVQPAETARAAARTAELRVSFASGNAELSADGSAAIRQLVASAPQGGGGVFTVVAYAAGVPGDPSVARRLSLSRALAVRSALIADGVNAGSITVRAMGSNVPSGPADRVDVSVFGGTTSPR